MGFTTEVTELRTAASKMGELGERVWHTAGAIAQHDDGAVIGGNEEQAWGTYLLYCGTIFQRLVFGVGVIGSTAEALRAIATVYARVDGQE